MSDTHEERKEAQLRVCLQEDVEAPNVRTGFERYRFDHQALPDLDLDEIDLSTSLFGKRLRAPILISAMTGGCRFCAQVNRNLAIAAQRLGLAMMVGSQRAGIVDPTLAWTYQVREHAPDILLLGNLGAVQLNAGFGVAECRYAVEMIDADALCLHLNGLQEVQQPAGDHNFRGLASKLASVVAALPWPVMVKEVGWGIAADTAVELARAGVSAIDVAGAGGTSWFIVQRLVAGETLAAARQSPFADWGIPTAESLRQVVAAVPHLPVVASGGIRDGVQAAKALAMGASAVGMALPLLQPATESAEAVIARLETVIHELRATMFAVGARDLAALRASQRLRPIT